MSFIDKVKIFKTTYPTLSHIGYYIVFLSHFLILFIPIVILLFSKNILLLMIIIMFEMFLLIHWYIHNECILTTIERSLSHQGYTQKQFNESIIGKNNYTILTIGLRPIIVLLALYRIYYLKCRCN